MYQTFLVYFLILPFIGFSQKEEFPFHQDAINANLLNRFIVKEINVLRKKEKVDSIQLNESLRLAADTHCLYMYNLSILTHVERGNKNLKDPKNRVDYFNGKFESVGENVLLNSIEGIKAKSKDKIEISYELLAKELVNQWKNSPPHYKNMVSPDFYNVYTAIRVTEKGKIFACQVFGGAEYIAKYAIANDYYKPYKSKMFRFHWWPRNDGFVALGKNNTIYYVNEKIWFTGLFWKNRWRSGYAADIVLKSQYPCDGPNYFNPEAGIRGIGLKPVYKKDFRKVGRWGIRGCVIPLGQLPSEIDEDFAINLTKIRKKRTWTNTKYDIIPSYFYCKIAVDFPLDSIAKQSKLNTTEIIQNKVLFPKAKTSPVDSTLFIWLSNELSKGKKLKAVELEAYASIEGGLTLNQSLYTNRLNYCEKIIRSWGIDSTKIKRSCAENFEGFRKDIKYSKHEHLLSMSNDSLQKHVSQHQEEFEYLLKNHRYVQARLIFYKDTIIQYSVSKFKVDLAKAIVKEDVSEIERLHHYAIGFMLEDSLSLDELSKYDYSKKALYAAEKSRLFLAFAYRDALIKKNDSIDSKDFWSKLQSREYRIALDSLFNGAFQIQKHEGFKSNDKDINTIAALQMFTSTSHFSETLRETFENIRKIETIDKRIQARLLLNLASFHDMLYFKNGSALNKLLLPEIGDYIKAARLSVDEIFDLSSYYFYYNQNKIAYSLIKSNINKTDDINHLIHFLKVATYSENEITKKEFYSAYKRAAASNPEKFCQSLNYYGINFQVMDDSKIKEIYCQACSK